MHRTTDELLPINWAQRTKSAILYVISLARLAASVAQARLAKRAKSNHWLSAENDQLRQELALLREERRIKDARMSRLAPQKRPHYLPTERLAILEFRAARGWNVDQTAKAFLVTPITISEWLGQLDAKGAEDFIALSEPVNKFPDFVRYIVQRLKLLCPWLGRQKIAEALCRAGLHLAASTVRRILREQPARPAAPKAAAEKPMKTSAPNEVWNVDLT